MRVSRTNRGFPLLTLTPGTANTRLTVPELAGPRMNAWLDGSTKPRAPICGAGRGSGRGAGAIATGRGDASQGSMAARSWLLLLIETEAPKPARAATVPRP